MVGLGLAGWAVWQFPQEVARWRYVAAVEAWRTARYAEAEALLSQAEAWNPREKAYPALRAVLAADQEQGAKARAAIAAALKQNPGDPLLVLIEAQLLLNAGDYAAAASSLLSLPPEYQKTAPGLWWLTLQHAGRSDEAIQIQREALKSSETTGAPPLEVALNDLAYALAVANRDLPEALELIERALDLRARRRGDAGQKNPQADFGMLDTRGYVLFRIGRLEEALADMQTAVQGLEAETPEGEQLQQRSPEVRRHFAVIYYHRGLVRQALGDPAAESDLARARKLLGREPDEHLF